MSERARSTKATARTTTNAPSTYSMGSDAAAPSPKVRRATRNTMSTGTTSTFLLVRTDFFLFANLSSQETVPD